ncbi:MAG: adenylate/guanylate cyclase domain-containing protein [Verrucomicrobia bacterium]|nr:adenylate/guanylate cyclase domain-containing protein [Verrucomicrobiota bacterium]
MKMLRRLAVAALIGLVCFAAMYVLDRTTSFLKRFEWRTYDLRMQGRNSNPLPTDPNIVLIGVDDPTRSILPWAKGRTWHAHVLDGLSDVLPMAIGYDILFKARIFEGMDLSDPVLADINAEDEQLAAALRKPDPPAVLAYNFVLPGQNETDAGVAIRPLESELAEARELLAAFEITKVRPARAGLERLEPADYASMPDPRFARFAKLGFINAESDADGVRRRLPMVMRQRLTDAATGKTRDAFYPSLTLLMVATYLEVEPGDIEVEIGREIRIPAKDKVYTVPIDAQGALLVNFAGPTTRVFNVYSFVQVHKWSVEKRADQLEQFADKMVFVGEMGTGTVDTKPTPLGKETELVAMHLNAANSILQQQFVREASRAWCCAILFAACVATAVVSSATSPRTSLLAALVLLLGYGMLAVRLFSASSFVLPMVVPMTGILVTFAVVVSYRYLTEERQKTWIRRAMGRYLSPSIMREVLEDPSKLALGGQRRTLTVLFSDIRSFTPFCESHEPEDVVAILNEYLDAMTQRIFEHSGTLDKYVGDEIVAFFGAPGAQRSDHALNAARAALAMKATLEKLQAKWREEGRDVLDFGVGLNTGEMLVGNMGSSTIFDYTVIGDQVNLGARVEALTRTYNCHIIITESTRTALGDHAETRLLGEATVKGKTKPIKVYELLGLKEA